MAGCGILFSASPRLPQFSEHSIIGPGAYTIPQWSPNSRYLAFLDLTPNLIVYDTENGNQWTEASDVSSAHFSWTPDGTALTYLKYRPDLSGSPYPIISDMHRVDLNSGADTVIAPNLSSAGDFAWFSDGQRAAILLTEPSSHTYYNDVYLLDTRTGTTSLMLKTSDLDLQTLSMLALSPDEKSILVYGIDGKNGASSAQIILYDLETKTVRERLIPSQIIPGSDGKYLWSGLLDSTNFGWVGGQRWFLTDINTPGGECYNYALFFFDMNDSQKSFCIPTRIGIIGDATISPDLTKISYVTVEGPGNEYVVIGDVTPDLLNKLELKQQNGQGS